MAFNKENKITWEELSPSLQEVFKGLQTQITKEAEERIKADNDIYDALALLEDKLVNLGKQIDLVRGASFKSWSIRLWENHHIFTDLSFYETHDVQQSGVTNKITDKRYNCIFGIMSGQININGEHPGWIKHQQPFTGPDGVRRVYLGCGIAISGGASVYRSDEQGLDFNRVAILGGVAIWDFCDASSIGAGLLAITYSPYAVYQSFDGVNWTKVLTPGGNVKTLCLFNGRVLCVVPGTTYYSSDGTNWSSVGGNGLSGGYSYSRYYAGKRVYIGQAGPSGISVSTDPDGFHYEKLKYPNGSTWSSGNAYVRWICSWQPANYNGKELICWGTGDSGLQNSHAELWCWDETDGSISLLYDFNGLNNYNVTKPSLNHGHAPLEPMKETTPGSDKYILTGFRESQIRYIEPFVNDYTGESFLLVGTSDCYFYNQYKDTDLYYQLHNYTTHVSEPLLNDSGEKVAWKKLDKEAWHMTDTSHFGSDQYGDLMGNVYAVSPRDETKPFRKDDLCIALIKHTEDTRVYSMSVFTDPQNVKWAYVGTGGGNYSGKGLLYRFGYSDMLNLIEAAKIGAIYPPKWARLGTGKDGVNTRLIQLSTRSFLKIMGGVSARDNYVEFKFAFNKKFLKSSGTNREPYIKLIFNHHDTANNYSIIYYPLTNTINCIRKENNVDFPIPTVQGNKTFYTTKPFDLWETTDMEEGSESPIMGPYYILAAKVNPGLMDPNAQMSEDIYPNQDLDGSIDFYFRESNNRQEHCTDGDRIASWTIDYAGGERKHIGNYGFETFDINGLMFISMHQMSLARYEKDAMEDGEIVFTVS